ncbi:hypothetical protein KY284_032884 [Solanum tuberosum]|nr:hypothetical protein KY284_032884 [Solanum tuberosum]
MSKKQVLIYSAESSVPIADICKGDALMDLESGAKIVNIDNNLADPQLCATMTYGIYNHLRASEAKKRPFTYFMAKVQKDINPGMRKLVSLIRNLFDGIGCQGVYRLVPNTLHLTINYRSISFGQFDGQTTTTVAWSILHDDRIKNMRRSVHLKSKSLLHNRQLLLQGEGVANGVGCFKLLEVQNDRFDSQMLSEAGGRALEHETSRRARVGGDLKARRCLKVGLGGLKPRWCLEAGWWRDSGDEGVSRWGVGGPRGITVGGLGVPSCLGAGGPRCMSVPRGGGSGHDDDTGREGGWGLSMHDSASGVGDYGTSGYDSASRRGIGGLGAQRGLKAGDRGPRGTKGP